MRALAVLLSAILLTGCAGAIAKDSQVAAQSAIATATDSDSQARIDAAVAKAVRSAVDAGLSPEVEARLVEIAHSLGAAFRQEISKSNAQVESEIHAEIVGLQDELGYTARALVQQLVRAAVDEALSDKSLAELDVVIARLQRLIDEAIDKAIDEAIDRAAARLAPAQAAAEADAAKLGRWIEGLGAAVGVFAIALVVALRQTRSHRRRLDAIESRLGHVEVP